MCLWGQSLATWLRNSLGPLSLLPEHSFKAAGSRSAVCCMVAGRTWESSDIPVEEARVAGKRTEE
jgi:hypothetical protein